MMRRMVMEDVTLSNGIFLPRGTQIGIPTRLHFDQNAYSDPEKFDGYRYVKMADDPQKEKFRHSVSTSPEHMGFGHGKHACPGRFFAANETKIALCHILMKYDFKLAEGSKPTVLKMGWVLSSDPMAQLMVKRREGVDEDLLHRWFPGLGFGSGERSLAMNLGRANSPFLFFLSFFLLWSSVSRENTMSSRHFY